VAWCRAEGLGLQDASQARRLHEWSVLHAMYHKAAIPGLITNFFKHYERNQTFWPPTFGTAAAPKVAAASQPVAAVGGATSHSTALVAASYLMQESAAAAAQMASSGPSNSSDVASPWAAASAFRLNASHSRSVALEAVLSDGTRAPVKISATHFSNDGGKFLLSFPKPGDEEQVEVVQVTNASLEATDAGSFVTAEVDGVASEALVSFEKEWPHQLDVFQALFRR
jgi:hypothetical protein